MEINLNKTENIHEINFLDITELQIKVSQLIEEDWDTKEDFEVNYNKAKDSKKGALNSTQHIIFRFTNKQSMPFQYVECSKWDNWKSTLLPIMNKATEYFNYKNRYYPKVMLANLPPKKIIRPHIDGNKIGYVPHKIHVPIQTNESAFFFLKTKQFHFKKGVAYEVNNGKKHSVVNNGNTNRIHLIFECIDYDIQTEMIKTQIKNRTKR